MSHPIKSARAEPGSDAPANSPPKAVSLSPQFTKSQQESSLDGADRPERTPNSADGSSSETRSPEELSPETLSLDATEPFPPGLFRVPVPNKAFDRMPSMSDSALRGLLALIHLSFRFDPADSEWVHSGNWFARSDVEKACGLSSQGTRNGLAELESIGWVRADRSGRSHQYRLTFEVPNCRFTYVPTALLEDVGEIGSGTELRVALVILRGTWGWTQKKTDPQSGSVQVVHDRWTQLSNQELAEATGRSQTAVTHAAKALQGKWVERTRPGCGPYQYRFLPKAIGDGPEPPDSFCPPIANNLTPDRQQSDPPTSSKESSSKDKHSSPQKKERPESTGDGVIESQHAVQSGKNPRQDPNHQQQQTTSKPREGTPTPDFSDLPPEKQNLAEKLQNVGVWVGRIAEILSRFSCSRIRANFNLYRRRAAEQVIRNPGAWLYKAITEGYALPNTKLDTEDSTSAGEPDGPPAPNHKEIVSEAEKEAYLAQGLDEERFCRCLSPGGTSTAPQFMYFDPDIGGPTKRT